MEIESHIRKVNYPKGVRDLSIRNTKIKKL